MEAIFIVTSVEDFQNDGGECLSKIVTVVKDDNPRDVRRIKLTPWRNSFLCGIELNSDGSEMAGTPYTLKEESGKMLRDITYMDILLEAFFPEALDNR